MLICISIPDCTIELLVIDAAIGAIFKTYMEELLDAWLEDDKNVKQWPSSKLPACKRRVFMTKWLGEAGKRFCNNVNIERMWHKVGTLLTINGKLLFRVLLATLCLQVMQGSTRW